MSSSNVSSFYDITNFTEKYQIGNVIIYSPYIKPLISSYQTLLYNSITIQMTNRYRYRPDYVSYDYYNTVNLWYVIMYMNNVETMTQFNMPSIIVPNFQVLNSILSQNKIDPTKVNPIVPSSL